jgi:hypothetical protein
MNVLTMNSDGSISRDMKPWQASQNEINRDRLTVSCAFFPAKVMVWPRQTVPNGFGDSR